MYDPTEWVGDYWFGYIMRHCKTDGHTWFTHAGTAEPHHTRSVLAGKDRHASYGTGCVDAAQMVQIQLVALETPPCRVKRP